jgi:hypothetical protein
MTPDGMEAGGMGGEDMDGEGMEGEDMDEEGVGGSLAASGANGSD